MKMRTAALALVLAGPFCPSVVSGQDEAGKEKARAGFSRNLQFDYEPREGGKRERRVYLWYPTRGEEVRFRYAAQSGMVAPEAPVAVGAHPLVVFSHGFWGAADQSVFLMEALARAGYVVASVHHEDATHALKRKRVPMPNFLPAGEWNRDKFFDRREDMAALLDYLLEQNTAEGSPLHGRIEADEIGGAGHSLGGYTMLGMAGGWESWKEKRMRAYLLLSPYVMPFLDRGALHGVSAPVMIQGGTWDLGVTTFLKRFYDQLETTKYYLVLRRAGHYAWTDLNSVGRTTTEALGKGNPRLIADYSIAFFDRHLRGLERGRELSGDGRKLRTWLSGAQDD